MVLVDGVSINQDEAHSYCIFANGGRLTITLVWTDYPASPAGCWLCVCGGSRVNGAVARAAR